MAPDESFAGCGVVRKRKERGRLVFGGFRNVKLVPDDWGGVQLEYEVKYQRLWNGLFTEIVMVENRLAIDLNEFMILCPSEEFGGCANAEISNSLRFGHGSESFALTTSLRVLF